MHAVCFRFWYSFLHCRRFTLTQTHRREEEVFLAKLQNSQVLDRGQEGNNEVEGVMERELTN